MIVHYSLALILITAIVFVEEIDVFRNFYMVAVLFALFVMNSLFVCQDNMPIGLLITCLFVLVYALYALYANKTKREESHHPNLTTSEY